MNLTKRLFIALITVFSFNALAQETPAAAPAAGNEAAAPAKEKHGKKKHAEKAEKKEKKEKKHKK